MKISEKLKIIRKVNNLTQKEFADRLGISRSNLSSIEQGVVNPTELFINCVCLMFEIDKNWLTDDSIEDLSGIQNCNDLKYLIANKYDKLTDEYKKFIEKQINELLLIQNKTE